MKRLSIDHPRLKSELRAAFREHTRRAMNENKPGESFNYAVMGEIRQIVKARAKRDRLAWIPKTAWRLAPMVCVILFALTVVFMKYDPSLEYDMAALQLTDPIGFHEANLFTF
jgi:hypothetical protein